MPQNSNLVLTAEQRTTVGHEPDGSAETLWGNMRGKMGDKVQRGLPEGLAERKAKRDATAGDGAGAKRRRVRLIETKEFQESGEVPALALLKYLAAR